MLLLDLCAVPPLGVGAADSEALEGRGELISSPPFQPLIRPKKYPIEAED
jgi:hypothetical protein